MVAPQIKLKTEGFDQLRRRLLRMDQRTIRKVTRKMVSAGARVIKKFADREVPVSTGTLRKSIKFRSMRTRFGESAAVKIHTTAPHSHLVQLGTNERFQQTGKSTGAMPGDDYFIRAFRAAEAETEKKMTESLKKSIDKELSR